MNKQHLQIGFALPTVMIASVVMLTVLLSGLVATSSVNVGLREQFNQKQLSLAIDAGMTMAEACIQANAHEITWSDDKPLMPNTNCDGDDMVSCPESSNDSRCYLINTTQSRTSFKVRAVRSADKSFIVEALSRSVRSSTGTIASEQKVVTQGREVERRATNISAGGSATCAVSSDMKVYCWGNNGYGVLGTGSTSTTPNPNPLLLSQGSIPANSDMQSVTTGFTHSCALTSAGKAYCWGTNGNGQLGNNNGTVNSYIPVAVAQGEIPDGVRLTSLTNGYYHTCATASDNKVYCWGDNTYGQLGFGTAGGVYSYPRAVSLPTGVGATSLSSAYVHTCAVGSDAKVYCWGYNGQRQLGNNSATQQFNSPVKVLTNTSGAELTAIAVGSAYYHSCAVGTDGNPYCWGQNSSYELGNGATTQGIVATRTSQGNIPTNVRLTHISTYYQHTCAIGSNSRVYCWGPNAYRQIGNASTTTATFPTLASTVSNAPGDTITGISVGDYHTCINNSQAKMYCWGYNTYGGLGNGTTNHPSDVTEVTGSNTPLGYGTGLSVVAGGGATCAISVSSRPYCWGFNSVGQLGNGNTTNSASPTGVANGAVIPVDVTAVSLSGGGGTVCMLGSNSKIYCWGSNDTGQLGNGNTTNSSFPVAVQQGAIPNGVSVRGLSVGGGLGTNACMVGTNGNAYCWGGNTRGQLGNGSTANSSTPVAVSPGTIPAGVTIRSISTGGETTCALASNDKAYCWGRNDWGQIGNGTTTASSTPVAVSQGAIPAGVTLRSISVGSTTCAVGSDSKAYCWGYNVNGTIGNGTTTASNVPVAVSQGSMPVGVKIKDLSITSTTACAIGTDLKAYCWGDNSTGQVGDGTGTNATTPKAVVAGVIPAGVTIRSIRPGGGHTCAIGSNSRVYCWGDNAWGQLGNGTFNSGSLSPVQPTQSQRWLPSVTVDSMIIRH